MPWQCPHDKFRMLDIFFMFMFSARFCGTYFQVFPIFVVPSACVICPPYLHAKLQHLKWSQTNYKRSTLNMHTLVPLMSVRVEMKTAPTIWFLVLTSSTSPYCLGFVAMSSYSYMSNVKLKFTKFIELFYKPGSNSQSEHISRFFATMS